MRFLSIVCFLAAFSSSAQRSLEVEFDKSAVLENYSIETLRFYLSNIRFHVQEDIWYDEPNSHHLIDIENPASWKIPLPERLVRTKIDSISFLIGVDSATNVAGILSGDLDPIKGMYWAWNSGYINFKVEGKKLETSSTFEYHLGGYLAPYCSSRALIFARKPKNKRLIIRLSLKQFLDQIDMATLNEVMIPGEEAARLSNDLVNCFSIE